MGQCLQLGKISVITVAPPPPAAAAFEAAISQTGYGKFNYLLLFMAFPASCVVYYDTTVLSLVLPAATCELKLNDYSKGYLIGAAYAGMIASAFLWGFLSDNYGRKKLLIIGYFLDSLFNFCSSFSRNFTELLILKFAGGVIVSGPYSIFMTYMSEIFYGKHRDRVIMNMGIFLSIGAIIQPTLAWLVIPLNFHYTFFNGLLETNSWRMFMIVSTAPSVLSCIFACFFVESPKFLLSKGKTDKALEVLRNMYAINTGKPRDTYPVKSLVDEQIHQLNANEQSHKLSSVLYRTFRGLTALFWPPYVKNALLMFAIQFGALMSMNTIRLWLPLLLHRVHKGSKTLSGVTICEVLELTSTRVTSVVPSQPCETFTVDPIVYQEMICVSVATSLVFMLGSYLAGKIEKRYFITSLYLVGSISSYLFVWVNASYVLLMASIYLSFMLASTIGLLSITVDFFPTNLRAMAVSLTMMFGRLGVLVGSVTMPIFMSINCWAPFTLVGTVLIGCIFGLLYLTRKRK